MRSEGYSTWSVIPFVCLSVCYHVFCHYAQQGGQKAIPTGSIPHWLDFKNGDFRKSTAFKSYGVKTKRTSQYANEHGLPRPDSARFQHGGGSRSNTKGEVRDPGLPKTLPTDVASPCVHCFPGSCVSVQHAYLYSMRICTACVFIVYAHAYFPCIYAHDTPRRVQHFSAFHCIY